MVRSEAVVHGSWGVHHAHVGTVQSHSSVRRHRAGRDPSAHGRDRGQAQNAFADHDVPLFREVAQMQVCLIDAEPELRRVFIRG